jgi:hypothetical protein
MNIVISVTLMLLPRVFRILSTQRLLLGTRYLKIFRFSEDGFALRYL